MIFRANATALNPVRQSSNHYRFLKRSWVRLNLKRKNGNSSKIKRQSSQWKQICWKMMAGTSVTNATDGLLKRETWLCIWDLTAVKSLSAVRFARRCFQLVETEMIIREDIIKSGIFKLIKSLLYRLYKCKCCCKEYYRKY